VEDNTLLSYAGIHFITTSSVMSLVLELKIDIALFVENGCSADNLRNGVGITVTRWTSVLEISTFLLTDLFKKINDTVNILKIQTNFIFRNSVSFFKI